MQSIQSCQNLIHWYSEREREGEREGERERERETERVSMNGPNIDITQNDFYICEDWYLMSSYAWKSAGND